MQAPVYSPQVPFNTSISGGFGPGKKVRIQGRVPLSSTSFAINFQSGPSSYCDDIPFQFNPRFNENAAVRRAKINSQWGKDERLSSVKGNFPFQRGQPFVIIITVDNKRFQVMVSGRPFASFHHKTSPEKITHLSIQGEVSISLIQFGLVESEKNVAPVETPKPPQVPANISSLSSSTDSNVNTNGVFEDPRTVARRESTNTQPSNGSSAFPVQNFSNNAPNNHYSIQSAPALNNPTSNSYSVNSTAQSNNTSNNYYNGNPSNAPQWQNAPSNYSQPTYNHSSNYLSTEFPPDPRSQNSKRPPNPNVPYVTFTPGNGVQPNASTSNNFAPRPGARQIPVQSMLRPFPVQNDTQPMLHQNHSRAYASPNEIRPFTAYATGQRTHNDAQSYPLNNGNQPLPSQSAPAAMGPGPFSQSNSFRPLIPTEVRPYLPPPPVEKPLPSNLTTPVSANPPTAPISGPGPPQSRLAAPQPAYPSSAPHPKPVPEQAVFPGQRTGDIACTPAAGAKHSQETGEPLQTQRKNDSPRRSTLNKTPATPAEQEKMKPLQSPSTRSRPRQKVEQGKRGSSLLRPRYLENQPKLQTHLIQRNEVSKKLAKRIRQMQKRERQRVEQANGLVPSPALPPDCKLTCQQEIRQASSHDEVIMVEADTEDTCVEILLDSPKEATEREDMKMEEEDDIEISQEVRVVSIDSASKAKNLKRPRETQNDEDPDLLVVVTYAGNLQESITDDGFNAFCSSLDTMICNSIRGPEKKAYRILGSTLTDSGRIHVNCLDQATVAWVMKTSSSISWNSPLETQRFRGWLSSEVPTIPKITYKTFKVWVPGVKPNLTEFFEVLQGLNEGLTTKLWRCYDSMNGKRDETSVIHGFDLILGIDPKSVEYLQGCKFSLFYGSNPIIFIEVTPRRNVNAP